MNILVNANRYRLIIIGMGGLLVTPSAAGAKGPGFNSPSQPHTFEINFRASIVRVSTLYAVNDTDNIAIYEDIQLSTEARASTLAGMQCWL